MCTHTQRQNIIMINQWTHCQNILQFCIFAWFLERLPELLVNHLMKLIGKLNKNKSKNDNRCLISKKCRGKGRASWTNSTFTMLCVWLCAYALRAFGFFQEWKKADAISICFYGVFVLGSFIKKFCGCFECICISRCQKKLCFYFLFSMWNFYILRCSCIVVMQSILIVFASFLRSSSWVLKNGETSRWDEGFSHKS